MPFHHNRLTALPNRLNGKTMDDLTLTQLAIYMRSRDYADKTINTYIATNRRWEIAAEEIDRAAIREWVWSADTQGHFVELHARVRVDVIP